MDPIAGSQLHSQVGGSILSSGCSRSGVFGVFLLYTRVSSGFSGFEGWGVGGILWVRG